MARKWCTTGTMRVVIAGGHGRIALLPIPDAVARTLD
jgi:hypothetical protein